MPPMPASAPKDPLQDLWVFPPEVDGTVTLRSKDQPPPQELRALRASVLHTAALIIQATPQYHGHRNTDEFLQDVTQTADRLLTYVLGLDDTPVDKTPLEDEP